MKETSFEKWLGLLPPCLVAVPLLYPVFCSGSLGTQWRMGHFPSKWKRPSALHICKSHTCVIKMRPVVWTAILDEKPWRFSEVNCRSRLVLSNFLPPPEIFSESVMGELLCRTSYCHPFAFLMPFTLILGNSCAFDVLVQVEKKNKPSLLPQNSLSSDSCTCSNDYLMTYESLEKCKLKLQ